MLDSDRDGQLTREEAEHAARLLGLQLVPAGASAERLSLHAFLQSLGRRTAELPEHALDVLVRGLATWTEQYNHTSFAQSSSDLVYVSDTGVTSNNDANYFACAQVLDSEDDYHL